MKILFADDEKNLREVLTDELKHLGHIVISCCDGNEAMAAIRKESFDVLLVDLDMPGAGGLEVIEHARQLGSDAEAVILTGKGTLETAVESMRYGVSNYLMKPYKIIDLEILLKGIVRNRELVRENHAMKKHIERIEGTRKLIGNSPAMQQVHKLINRIAPTESTVVILGDTGTGKELVARAVHENSRRSNKPFVAVNCGALPETLIESELFGHRKGSFTGADSNRTGLLEVADGGTLFLDEIGELPKGVQAKLLRFLESGEVRKIGENTSTTCDVRVVCATLRDLETMVRSGDFREDLWFRINTFEIHLPSLKDRKEDIPELILHLVGRFRADTGSMELTDLFTSEALKLLMWYDWPGNVRQLANTIEHALILADGFPIGLEELPQTLRPRADKPELTIPKQGRITEKKPNRPIVSKSVSDSSMNLPTVSGPIADLMSFDPVIEDSSAALETFHEQTPSEQSLTEPTTLRDLEMKAIEASMIRHGGNKSKVAEELGISLKTLYNKLNQSDKRTA